MTAADLARITEAIAADERTTEVSNWPLSRERTRAYLALARAVATGLASEIVAYQEAAAAAQTVIDGDASTEAQEIAAKLRRDAAEARIGDGDDAIMKALAALAPAPEVPDTDAWTGAGEAGR